MTAMLTTQELEEVKAYVLRELPRVLEQDPQFVTLVENIVNEKFPRRDEFARLLDELTASRWENRVHFDSLAEWRESTRKWREQTDERLDKIDERFDKVDERFDKIDEWRSKTDEWRGDTDKWRSKVDGDLLYLRREAIHTRQRFDQIDRTMKGQNAWMQLYSGRLGSDKGQRLEDTFALALRYGLRNPDLSPDDIYLRVKLTDREGLVYPPGAVTEIDVVIQGQRWTVFEIKAAAVAGDVDSFALKLKLLRLQQPEKEIRGVFFSCLEDNWLQQRCQLYQVELIEPFATLPGGPIPEEEIDAILAQEKAAESADEEIE